VDAKEGDRRDNSIGQVAEEEGRVGRSVILGLQQTFGPHLQGLSTAAIWVSTLKLNHSILVYKETDDP